MLISSVLLICVEPVDGERTLHCTEWLLTWQVDCSKDKNKELEYCMQELPHMVLFKAGGFHAQAPNPPSTYQKSLVSKPTLPHS